MFSVNSHIEFTFEDNKYCLVFDLYVMNQLQDVYGTLCNWAEKLSQRDFNALLSTLTFMLNEGAKKMKDEGNIDYNFPKHESIVKIAITKNIYSSIDSVMAASLGNVKNFKNSKNSKESNNEFKEKIDFAHIYMFCVSQLHMPLDQSKTLTWNDYVELNISYFKMFKSKGQKSFKEKNKGGINWERRHNKMTAKVNQLRYF
jgi:hypothetical protein